LRNLNHQEKAKADDWTVARYRTSELAQLTNDWTMFTRSGALFRASWNQCHVA